MGAGSDLEPLCLWRAVGTLEDSPDRCATPTPTRVSSTFTVRAGQSYRIGPMAAHSLPDPHGRVFLGRASWGLRILPLRNRVDVLHRRHGWGARWRSSRARGRGSFTHGGRLHPCGYGSWYSHGWCARPGRLAAGRSLSPCHDTYSAMDGSGVVKLVREHKASPLDFAMSQGFSTQVDSDFLPARSECERLFSRWLRASPRGVGRPRRIMR